MNELLFLAHSATIALITVIATYLGSHALIALICVLCIFSNVFVLKQITLAGTIATPTDALAVGVSLAFNMLNHYWGKALAQKAIFISFFCAIACVLLSLFQLGYHPSASDTFHDAYYQLFSPAPRIIVASLFSYILVQYLDCWLYTRLKTTLSPRLFVINNYISTGISQLFDSFLFTFLALYGIVDNLYSIITVSYVIKLIILITAVPCMAFFKQFITRLPHD